MQAAELDEEEEEESLGMFGYDDTGSKNGKHTRFQEEPTIGSAASGASGKRKKIRSRQATGFIRADALPEEGGLRFQDEVSVVEAASSITSPSGRRPVKSRMQTGFVRDILPDEGESRGIHFME